MNDARAFISGIVLVFAMASSVVTLRAEDTAGKYDRELGRVDQEIAAISASLDKRDSGRRTRIWLNGFLDFKFFYNYYDLNPFPSLFSSSAVGLEANEPNLQLQFHYGASPDLVFHAQIGVRSPFDGGSGHTLGIANDFYLRARFNSGVGVYELFAGGPFWELRNSLLTMSSGIGGGRPIPFERFPWDKVEVPAYMYDKYVTEFGWVQSTDVKSRLGSIGARGAGIEGRDLPWGLGLLAFAGFVDGWYGSKNIMAFGNISRKLGSGYVALNAADHSFNAAGRKRPDRSYQNMSVSAAATIAGFKVTSEAGISLARIPALDEQRSGYAIFADVLRSFPGDVNFRLASWYADSGFAGQHTGVVQIEPVLSTESHYLENILPEAQALYNGRWEANLRAGFRLANVRFDLMYSASRTIHPTGPIVTFPHHLNHSQWYAVYNGRQGSYAGTLSPGYDVDYEGAYEQFSGSRSGSSRKTFAIAALGLGYDLGYLAPFLRRTFVSLRAEFKTVNYDSGISSFSAFSSRLLSTAYWSFFASRELFPNFCLIGFNDRESFFGNGGGTIDQADAGWGLGFDYVFLGGSAVYLKVRRSVHRDFLAGSNDFSAVSSSLEFKSYF